LDHGSPPKWRGEIHAVLIAFAQWERLVSFDGEERRGEERSYLQRKADGISAGERRTLIDNNNRQRAGRDTTFEKGYHDRACGPKERDGLTDISAKARILVCICRGDCS
jgi:hypothetical protein